MLCKKASNQLTLGELIDALKRCNQDASINFDFCMFVPAGLRSYRGYYEDLALGFETGDRGYDMRKVGSLVGHLEDCMYALFEGYKGGHYRARRDTPMWVDNSGDASGTAIVGVKDFGHWVAIQTEAIE